MSLIFLVHFILHFSSVSYIKTYDLNVSLVKIDTEITGILLDSISVKENLLFIYLFICSDREYKQ